MYVFVAWYLVTHRGKFAFTPAEAGNFSLHHRVQNGSGAHPASYPMGIRGYFPGSKLLLMCDMM
jgi:hypothetical protein